MTIRTINLKLHKPSTRKKLIIDEALKRYTRAFQFLLDKSQEEIDDIRSKYKDAMGNYKALSLSKWVDSNISSQLNAFEVQPFKDSLKIDFGMTLAGYLSLKNIQQDAGFPVAHVKLHEMDILFDRATEELIKGEKTLGGFKREAEKLLKKSSELKPIFFCRYDYKRDYCFLFDPESNRYYAKLYLLNVKSEKRIIYSPREEKSLYYISKKGKGEHLLERTGKQERYIIVPLSFGKWQEDYLKKAVENPEMLKTARLSKKNGEYYLSVNIDIGDSEAIKPVTYMGICRALKSPLYYTVANENSELVAGAPIMFGSETKADRTRISDNHIHTLANDIVRSAVKYKSQVIVQHLGDKGDRLAWVDDDHRIYLTQLNCHSYNKLVQILDYKLTGVGLPAPVKVSPVGIFYTCPVCGQNTAGNRFSKDMFICTTCGTSMEIDSLGSVNLSRKLINYGNGILKVKAVRMPEGIKFINEDLNIEFYPSNPYDCLDEFKEFIGVVINDFRSNMSNMVKDKSFKKKYSLIKKIEEQKDLSKLIQVL